MRFVVGKPLERWMLLIDLPYRKLAIINHQKTVESIMLDRAGHPLKSGVVYELLRPLIGEGVFAQPGGASVVRKHGASFRARLPRFLTNACAR